MINRVSNGVVDRRLAIGLLLMRVDPEQFDGDDMVRLLQMNVEQIAHEVERCLNEFAPCMCDDPDCKQAEYRRRKHDPTYGADGADAADTADPLDRPATPGESRFADALKKLDW